MSQEAPRPLQQIAKSDSSNTEANQQHEDETSNLSSDDKPASPSNGVNGHHLLEEQQRSTNGENQRPAKSTPAISHPSPTTSSTTATSDADKTNQQQQQQPTSTNLISTNSQKSTSNKAATSSSSSSSIIVSNSKRQSAPAASQTKTLVSKTISISSSRSADINNSQNNKEQEEDVIIADAMSVDVISGQVLKKTSDANTTASTNTERDSGLQSPNDTFPAFPEPPASYHQQHQPQAGKMSPIIGDDQGGDHSELYVLCCARCLCLSSLTNQSKQPKFNPKKLVQGVPLEEIRSWGNSFESMMRHECGRKVFAEFLRHEYSEENMLFWSACEELKKETDSEKLAERARLVYNDYVSVLSPREVSLDAHVRELINQRITKPNPDIFKEAQAQIFILMQRDSYPRFIVSPLYMKVAHYKQKKSKLKKSNSLEQSKQ